MRYIIAIGIFLSFFKLPAQTIASMARSICDSIQQVSELNAEKRSAEQRRIYHNELTRYPTLLVDITGLNRPREFNEYNYRINRELMKTCKGFEDQFSFLPLSKILDLEGLFNEGQYDSLEGMIIQFIHYRKTDLVLITVDDPYPDDSFSEFVQNKGDTWKIGGRYENGGLILAYSSALKGFMVYKGKLSGNYPKADLMNSIGFDEETSPFDAVSGVLKEMLR